MVYVSQINFFFPPYGGRMMNVCELVESIKVDKEKFYLLKLPTPIRCAEP